MAKISISDKISMLEFLPNSKIKVYFYEKSPRILNDVRKLKLDGELDDIQRYIKDFGERLYYRVETKNKATWYTGEVYVVPTHTQQKLERILTEIKCVLDDLRPLNEFK